MAKSDNPIRAVRLGRLRLVRNLALAPMHEHTHLVLRLMCRRQGAAVAHTEMAAPEDLLRGPGRKAENILASTPEDRPLGVQLLPVAAATTAKAVAMLRERSAADLVDLNFACPSERVVRSGRGGAMLRKPDLAVRIVEAAVKAAGPLPVTVKIRLGFTASEADREQALAIARAAAAGAAGITLHARTVGQGYAGRADWTAIARWAEALPVPVFGSGDLRSPEAVLEMLRETGCAGASIARGALGAPWIFSQAIALAETGTYEPASMQERRAAILEHFDGLAAQYGERAAAKFIRRMGAYYARGVRGAAQARAAFQKVRSAAAFRKTVEAWFGE
jgi:nifR3 family TIM-barrel protein